RVFVAASNGPTTTVVAGERSSVLRVIAELSNAGAFCRLVDVDYASHTPQMRPLADQLYAALSSIGPLDRAVPFYSAADAAPREPSTAPIGRIILSARFVSVQRSSASCRTATRRSSR